MGPVPDDNIQQLTVEEYEDAIETLEATQELCQRLDDPAMGQLSGSCLTLPLQDLIRYCTEICLRCKSYLAGERPLLSSDFAREHLWHDLEALGIDPNVTSNIHDTTILALLVAECNRRTLEVLGLLDNELDRISGREAIQTHEGPEVTTPQNCGLQRFVTAATEVRNNPIFGSTSQYMVDKQRRTEDEVERQILPSILASRTSFQKWQKTAILLTIPVMRHIMEKLRYPKCYASSCKRHTTNDLLFYY